MFNYRTSKYITLVNSHRQTANSNDSTNTISVPIKTIQNFPRNINAVNQYINYFFRVFTSFCWSMKYRIVPIFAATWTACHNGCCFNILNNAFRSFFSSLRLSANVYKTINIFTAFFEDNLSVDYLVIRYTVLQIEKIVKYDRLAEDGYRMSEGWTTERRRDGREPVNGPSSFHYAFIFYPIALFLENVLYIYIPPRRQFSC